MASSLRDIPGANRRTSTFRRRRSAPEPRLGPPILIDPRASLYDRGRPPRGPMGGRGVRRDRRRRLAPVDLALALSVVAVLGFLGWKLWSTTRVDVDITGIQDEGAITFEGSGALDVSILVNPAGRLESATLALDGQPLDDVVSEIEGGLRWVTDKPLTTGAHKLVLTVPRPILPASRFVWDFVVDSSPPKVDVPKTLLDPIGIDDPVVVQGTVDTDATLTANGDDVPIDEDDGSFEVAYERAPAGPIRLVATDKAGQTTIKEIFVPIARPVTRGVHMSAISWSTPELRDAVLDLVDRGVINTVELDIKDEGGEVGWDTSVPLAAEIGAIRDYYDLGDAVRELKERDVYVIGRVVAFRDPILATGAWEAGNRDWVLQQPNGEAHGSYGGFTNFMHPEVRKYNLDLALEAVDLGVDEILWDYVRRPEGALEEIVVPGLPAGQTIEESVASFLVGTHRQLRLAGALQGASLFGIAADRPAAVGQSVPMIARAVDYIAPMVYPSLWVMGEYRVSDPPRMPFEIVTRSLEDFQKKAKGTGVTLVPWLQDFSLGVTYGAEEVREQVLAAQALGIDSFLLWSPRVRYHAELLSPMER